MFRAWTYAALIILALAACSGGQDTSSGTPAPVLRADGRSFPLVGAVHASSSASSMPWTMIWATSVPDFCAAYTAHPCAYSFRPPPGVEIVAYGVPADAGTPYAIGPDAAVSAFDDATAFEAEALSGTVTLTPVAGSAGLLDVNVDATFASGPSQARFASTPCPALVTAPSATSWSSTLGAAFQETAYCASQYATRTCTLTGGVWTCTCEASDGAVTSCASPDDPANPGAPATDCCPNPFL